jgi:predicted transcriptional regulator
MDDVKQRLAQPDLFDRCFQLLTETEGILTHVREVFRGLAQGRDTLTPEKAAAIVTVIETARVAAAARVLEYKRLHEDSPEARVM